MKARLYLYVVVIALMTPFSTLAQGNGNGNGNGNNGNGNGNNGNGSNGGGTSTSCAALPTLPILIRSAIVPTDVGQDIFYTNETGAVKLKFVMAGYTYRISNCGIGVEDTYMFIIDDATGTAIACADDVCEQQSEIIFKAPVSALYTVLIKLDASGNFGDTRVPGFEIELLSDDPNYVHGGGSNGGGNPNSGPGNNNAGGNGQLQNTFWNQEGTTTTSDPELFLGTASATDMVLRTDGQNRMAITSGGDIKMFGLADQSITGPRIATIDKDGIVKGGIELDDGANAFTNCSPILPWIKASQGTATILCSDIQRVGIGVSTPGHTLDVDGEVRSSAGFVFPDGTIQTSAATNQFNELFVTDYIRVGTSSLYLGGSSSVTGVDNTIHTTSGPLSLQPTGGQVTIGEYDALDSDKDAALDAELSVAGEIYSEAVVVAMQVDWPDYVFAKNYDLLTLPELEKYIQDNEHLPNVPSAVEVEKAGSDLGEMDAILLRKIEELTLYVIQLEKEIETLKAQKNDE